MNPITIILSNLIYRPIFNIIVILLAIFWWNLGIAIILLTLIIRLALLKPSMHANNMQKNMVDIQPKMKELQERYKDDPQKLGEETMKLMKWNSSMWWMLTGCKMMLIQIPVFIWLFYVIRDFSKQQIDKSEIYSFLHNYIHMWIDKINSIFLWIDILKSPAYLLNHWNHISWLIITILAWILMWTQMKLTMLNKPQTPSIPTSMPWMPKIPNMSKMMWMMNIFMIWMMMMFVFTMPTGIGLYILTSTSFTIVQYSIQYKELIKVKYMIWKNKSTNITTK